MKLDDVKQTITGKEQITYHNNSPDPLSYLWIQLDQNMRSRESDTKLISTSQINKKENFSTIQKMQNDFDGGFKNLVGAQTDEQPYRTAIEQCGERTVPDIDVDVSVEWKSGGTL